ncbi:MAG: hypothetical protein RBU37_03065 [Myxococcota bacterium]|jgi:hypothetical protein|nr:hypothetical protein [Myxococcota bacterium]
MQKDELTFYACDTRVLEEKIMPRDMVEGTEIAGYLERFGEHLGTIYFESISIAEIFRKLEELSGAPFRFLLGAGERRLDPCGPVTYCGRQIPAEMGEFAYHINEMMKLKKKAAPSEKEREKLDKWLEFEKKIGLEQHDPGALEGLRKFLERQRGRTPELISVYTRWSRNA